jgi:hypothetical protein
MTSTGYRQRAVGESDPGHRIRAPQCAATFRHDSPPARPIGAAGALEHSGEMDIMDAPRTTPATDLPPSASRWDGLVNWLALLMLLAGSVVWPR